ncbi:MULTISPECIES: MmcB family DNA repair protein [unclassified Paracoccus (in: a-proteobacteria)]|uniref:MmcB family DNA repair protein n=1 Tax=unclassified Paracoccus (in: a-proteobacteria) TaxID=2688777 RepID=UPI0012B31B4B|nr:MULTISPECIES: MmcB family DNA repair protein [unclassified Paracoccus (in: a-proteobacteria)]UXU74520.1 MmcB family DNA repair protein [Paracoccus sp. SMMA_5]UXU80413.1 MmcB family DNA repair protein [Paracoccus sp. SMMA_5_TC]
MTHPDAASTSLPLRPGQRLARGVSRYLIDAGHAPLVEFVPDAGLRVDVVSISPKGEIWIVECKSSRADFLSDRKWQGYLDFCDRFFWAVDETFPDELLPLGAGLIRADNWAAEMVRMAPETRLPAARRARLLRDIARVSSRRLMALTDPIGVSGAAF